jgi:hypothetical protein
VAGSKLVNNGNGGSVVLAPINLVANSDYPLDADVQFVRYTGVAISGFGLVLRAADKQRGYELGHCAQLRVAFVSCNTSVSGDSFAVAQSLEGCCGKVLQAALFRPVPGTTYHFRAEAKGTFLTLTIGAITVGPVADTEFLAGGRIGMWSDACQISVTNFQVTAL